MSEDIQNKSIAIQKILGDCINKIEVETKDISQSKDGKYQPFAKYIHDVIHQLNDAKDRAKSKFEEFCESESKNEIVAGNINDNEPKEENDVKMSDEKEDPPKVIESEPVKDKVEENG